jgi:hypothetical protein
MNAYMNQIKNLQKISNLNKNNLKFHAVRHANGVKLSLKNNGGEEKAYIIVEPTVSENNKMGIYLALGRSHVKLKGYGLYLRSLANKVARNIGSTQTTQLAVNINNMGGSKAPSSYLLERMGANTTWNGQGSSMRKHRIDPLKSRTTKILAKRYGVRPPNLPRKLNKTLMNSVNYTRLPNNAHSVEKSHRIIIGQISNRGLKEALDPMRRRIKQKMISPKNLFGWYVTILRHRTHARGERVRQLEKRKAKTALRRRPSGRTLVNYSNL